MPQISTGCVRHIKCLPTHAVLSSTKQLLPIRRPPTATCPFTKRPPRPAPPAAVGLSRKNAGGRGEEREEREEREAGGQADESRRVLGNYLK